MKVVLDLNSASSYSLFLQIKSLPRYRFVGREASFPDEYADQLGLRPEKKKHGKSYRPLAGMFDYQEAVSGISIAKQKFAAFMAPGMGKTLVMTEFAKYVSTLLPRLCTLLVSPLMVIRQTLSEVERFYGSSLKVEQVRARDLARWLEVGRGVGITNYESIVEGLPCGRLASLIPDESSLLKSHYGAWGTRLISMGRGLNWKLCLTGTPAPNDRIEYANHAVFLDQFPTVNSFLARYFVNRGQTNERWELKPHALRPFYRSLAHWSIFLSDPSVYGWKDNVNTLPPINVHIQDVELTAAQSEAALKESGSLFPVAGGITSRARMAQIAKGNNRGEKIETLKPAYIKALVDSWPDRSTLIWCRFNQEQETLARLMPEAANISGDTPEDERIRLIAEFQAGRIKTLISKPKILGFGLNLAICTRMIFSTLMDSFEEYFQAVKRANRYGSTEALEVYVPITDLERPMVENVLRKAKMVEQDTREQERMFREYGYAA